MHKDRNKNQSFFGLILLIILLIQSCGWESEYRDAAIRSLQADTDIILVPYPFNIFDREARESITLSHYTKDELKEILLQHDISWEDLRNSWGWNESEQHFEKEVNYTSHYTNYSYDANIPIWIYGPNWFHAGAYPDMIHQQHIPSLVSRVLNFQFLNKLDTTRYDKIFRDTKLIPEIIVTLVVDQGGDQLYKAHRDAFPFLKSLKKDSVFFEKARVGHLEAHTAVGHAAIGTGTYPRESHTFSNEIYTWKEGKVNARSVYQGKEKDLNLYELNTLTLADEWDRKNNNVPVVISQCYAARASIGMAGHGLKIPEHLQTQGPSDSDFVYWENNKTLRWDTDDKAFQVPNLLKNVDLYSFYLSNKNQIQSSFSATDKIDFLRKLHFFQASEFQVNLDGNSFRGAIQDEILDKKLDRDGKADLVYLTLKATDAVGHLYGWESKESEKILLATDQEIRKIFDFLRSHYEDRFIMIVTADHGAAPMPEISKGSFLTHDVFFKELSMLLPESERVNRSLVKWVTHSQLSLDHQTMKDFNISEEKVIEALKNLKVGNKPFFRRVWNRRDLASETR